MRELKGDTWKSFCQDAENLVVDFESGIGSSCFSLAVSFISWFGNCSFSGLDSFDGPALRKYIRLSSNVLFTSSIMALSCFFSLYRYQKDTGLKEYPKNLGAVTRYAYG